jgi:hypothetical protein
VGVAVCVRDRYIMQLPVSINTDEKTVLAAGSPRKGALSQRFLQSTASPRVFLGGGGDQLQVVTYTHILI